MPKAIALTADDLQPTARTKPSSASRPRSAAAAVPSDEYIPMQFRLPPLFVKKFKQTALDEDKKLNELLISCFNEYLKSRGQKPATLE